MVRTSKVIALVAGVALAACAGKQIPQHSGYKGKKPTPWTKAKVIELDDALSAKVESDLDYGEYKRAKWYSLTVPGPGELTLDLEAIPSGDHEMDVALEVLDPHYKVLVRADADADDANEQKKQRKVTNLDEGTYLIHVYLEGRLDAADFELKLKYARGTKAWKSDFPMQVAYVDELPAITDDDTPIVKPKPPKPPKPGDPKPKPPKPEPETGPGPLGANISDVQPDGNGGSKLVIAAGQSDGVDNGMKGSVPGIKNNTFTLFSCNAGRCLANVKAAPDDVRGVGQVIIRR